jgi:ribonuclease T2
MYRVAIPVSIVGIAALSYAWSVQPSAAPLTPQRQTNAATCVVPNVLPAPKIEDVPPGEVMQVPTTGYTLALSWSPQFCRDKGRNPKYATQCDANGQFGFILHGLWPEGHGGRYAAWCKPVDVLSRNEVRSNFCMMPSPQLMQHEWAKHGVCQWQNPSDYFAASRKQFDRFNAPDMTALSILPVDSNGFKDALHIANPTFPLESFSLLTSQGNWLKEVHICMDKAFNPIACRKRRDRAGQSLKIWRAEK